MVKGGKKLVANSKNVVGSVKQQAAKKILKKDHSDSNMMVAIRIRPLDNKEKANKEFEIIRTEDKLLVSKCNASIYKPFLFLDRHGPRGHGIRERGQKARRAASFKRAALLLRSYL